MKRKIFWVLATMITLMALVCGCSNSSDTTIDETSAQKTEEKKTSKRKYDNINADSTPIGIEEVKFSNSKDITSTDTHTMLSGRIYKNSSDIEESLIDEYICGKTFVTKKSLTEGENERFSDDIIWETISDDNHKKNVSDENTCKVHSKNC